MGYIEDMHNRYIGEVRRGEREVFCCDNCNQKIFVNDKYYRFFEEILCTDCVEERVAETDDFPDPDWD